MLSWWALVSTPKASTTLTMLAILVLGLFLFARGPTTIGGIVMFMSFAAMLIQRLEQAASFVNRIFMDVPKLEQFFAVLDTTASVKDGKNAVTLKNVGGEVAFDRVSFSYDGKNSAVADLNFVAKPGETIALVGATGAGKSTAARCSTASMTRNPARSGSTGAISATSSSRASGGTWASSSRSRCVQLDRGEFARRQSRRERSGPQARLRAGAGARLH